MRAHGSLLRIAIPLFLFFVCLSPVFPQSDLLRGIVLAPDNEPLAFVSVLVNGANTEVVHTDIEGRFRIAGRERVTRLVFRYTGFETLILNRSEFGSGELRVTLQPAVLDLPEALILPGENPADVIMRRVAAHRHQNNPERKAAYECTLYSKMRFELAPNRTAFEKRMAGRDQTRRGVQKQIEDFEKSEARAAEQHLMLMESVVRRAFLYPDQVSETVLLNRVSGFHNSGFAALAHAVQPFSFYSDYLPVLDKNFVNPVRPGSPSLYLFQLQDTVYAESDTTWIITFRPRRGKVFEALEGELHINSRQWAVERVRARPAFPSELFHLKIEQAYQWVSGEQRAGQWFPEQLHFEIETPKYPAPELGLRLQGRSYIRQVNTAPTHLHPLSFDPLQPLLMAPGAETRNDSLWDIWRDNLSLDPREARTYQFMDSIGDKNGLDAIGKLGHAVSTGRWPIRGNLCLDFNRLIRFSEYEGARIGLGLSNGVWQALQPRKRFESGVYAGYGLRDRAWKYGAYLNWRPGPYRRAALRLDAQDDLVEPGILYELNLPAFFNRSFYAVRMDRVRQIALAAEAPVLRSFLMRVSLRRQQLTPAYPYAFVKAENPPVSRFEVFEAGVFLRFAPAERSQRLFGQAVGAIQRWPVCEIAFTQGFDGLAGGQYAYRRYLLGLYQTVSLRPLGQLSWRVEAGLAEGQAPMSRLFTLNNLAVFGGVALFVLPHTFQVLPDTLFLSNRFVNAYMIHEVGPIFYRHKYSSPELSFHQHLSWGTLSNPEAHLQAGFRSAQPAFLESGIRIDHLAQVNYANLARLGIGAAVFYRWGGLRSDKVSENFSPRLSVKIRL